MMVRIQNFNVAILLDIARTYVAGAGHVDNDSLRTFTVQLCGNTLDIEHDLTDIFLDTGDGGDLMEYTVDLNRNDSDTGERAEQDTAQGVAERRTVASFQGLNDKLAGRCVLAQVHSGNIGLLDFNHLLPSYYTFEIRSGSFPYLRNRSLLCCGFTAGFIG